MSAEHLSIPLFPLHTVLYPGGVLPLKIFEQRYLEMTKACLRDGSPFGACLIREGSEVGTPAVPETVGCLATITEWDMPHPGMFHLVVRGGVRFRALATRSAGNGLISAEVELLPAVAAPAGIDATCRRVLELVISRVGAERFPAPIALDDADWVSYRLAEVLPLDLPEKQQILEACDAAERFLRLREALSEQGIAS